MIFVRYLQLKFGYEVLCPKCGMNGFAPVRNVRSSYSPKRSRIIKSLKSTLYVPNPKPESKKSYNLTRIDRVEYWSNRVIRGHSKDGAYIREIAESDKENVSYKVYTKTYPHLYIGHYSSHTYGLKKIDYDQGILKSRPNLIIEHINLHSQTTYHSF